MTKIYERCLKFDAIPGTIDRGRRFKYVTVPADIYRPHQVDPSVA